MQPSSSRDDEKDHPELPDRLDLLDRSDPRDREERSERLEEEATEGGDEVRETAAPVDGPPAAASGSSGNVPYAGISSTMLHATSYAWLNLTSSLSTFWALPTLHLHWQLLEQNVFLIRRIGTSTDFGRTKAKSQGTVVGLDAETAGTGRPEEGWQRERANIDQHGHAINRDRLWEHRSAPGSSEAAYGSAVTRPRLHLHAPGARSGSCQRECAPWTVEPKGYRARSGSLRV